MKIKSILLIALKVFILIMGLILFIDFINGLITSRVVFAIAITFAVPLWLYGAYHLYKDD